MMKLLLLGLSAFFAVGASAENLITNGELRLGRLTVPEFWTPADKVTYNTANGPNGQDTIAFLSGKGGSLRQYGMILVCGEKYRLSGYYKTKNFKAADVKVVIHNAGWVKDEGVKSFPPSSDWIKFEKTFTAFDSPGEPDVAGRYGVAIYLKDVEGEIYFADICLEALTEKGMKESSSALASAKIDRLTPMQPLLNHIPIEKPELTFRCLDKLPFPYSQYDAVSLNPQQTVKLNQDGIVTLKLNALKLGDHTLSVSLIERSSGRKVFESDYQITIIKTPEINTANHKVLNNLATEILNKAVAEELQFSNPRDGWVFISVPAKATVKLDGKDLYLPEERPEAVALLKAGNHRLNIAGAANGNVIVRSIAEIFNYPPLSNSIVTGNGSYGWDFMKKHVNYAVTTFNGGILNPDKKISDEIKKMGFIWLTNNTEVQQPSPNVAKRLDADKGLNNPQFAGVTCDEFGFNDITLLNRYSQMLRNIKNTNNSLIYTWIVGKPSMWLHSDFMATAVNIGKGKGKILYEAYCYPQANEKAAQDYLNLFLVDTITKFNEFYPNVNPNTGMILGNFTQVPVLSLDMDTAVDFKYYLDMQMHTIANNPEFKNLGSVGYWGSYYADEEIYRWSFKLMRHYVIEGKKNLLSEEYGFKYNPDLLKNGDFANGFTNWEKNGTITTDSLPGYGKVNQKRWNAPNGMGNTFAKFIRSKERPDTLTQKAVNLVPGKLYCLQFVVADYQDVKNKTVNPRQLGLNVELPGTEIIRDKSFVYIDNRDNKKLDFGRINLHRIVFKAAVPEQILIFSNEKASAGQELILNYVKLTPYFE